MKKLFLFLLFTGLVNVVISQDITPIPNNDFESWTTHSKYSDPEFWDTPNEELCAIPIFGKAVVERSTDHQSGSYAAKLETKSITMVGDIPGVITLGNITLDVSTFSYSINGGVPINDMPTHLMGYYKYFPVGGDSCAIGIGLLKWSGTQRDSVAYGVFSTKETVPDWTPFSTWIEYDTVIQPDSMIVLAISSAQEVPTAGTVLYVDNLYLDYTVSVDENDPATGIRIYQDRETGRLLLFTDFTTPQSVVVNLYNMRGQLLVSKDAGTVNKTRVVVPYSGVPDGIYILEVIHGKQKYTRKYFLSN